ncbi:MAG: hypothetical protein AAF679_13660, partial [Pseudomonadota bacterium]
WVTGAVFGWVFAVVAVYNAIRFTETEVVQDTAQEPPALVQDFDAKSLSEIAPASGGNMDTATDLDE